MSQISHEAWRLQEVDRIEKALKDIPGEPCGTVAEQCNNPRHLEYFNLVTQLMEIKYGKNHG